MRNAAFTALLGRMAELHETKNQDYASDLDPLSNFREAGEVARGFTGADAVFASLIGVKLARLRELTATGKTPNHESIADTRTDLAMYATLWAAYHEPKPCHDDLYALAKPCVEIGCDVLTHPGPRCIPHTRKIAKRLPVPKCRPNR